jgi:hypothetical protein
MTSEQPFSVLNDLWTLTIGQIHDMLESSNFISNSLFGALNFAKNLCVQFEKEKKKINA